MRSRIGKESGVEVMKIRLRKESKREIGLRKMKRRIITGRREREREREREGKLIQLT